MLHQVTWGDKMNITIEISVAAASRRWVLDTSVQSDAYSLCSMLTLYCFQFFTLYEISSAIVGQGRSR